MATSLRNHLNDLASVFASSVLAAIRGASLEDLLSETTAGGGRRGARGRPAAARGPAGARAPSASRGRGRLARRSAADIAGVIEKIVGLLKQNPRGLRAEQIRARLGLLAKEMPRPLKEALAAGRIGKSGQKRSTVYFLKGAGAPARATGAKKSRASAPARARRARKPGGKRSKVAARGTRGNSSKRARRAKAKPSAKRASRPRPRRRGGKSAKRARPAKPAKKAGRGGARPAPAPAAAGGGTSAPSPAPGAAS